MNDVGDQYRIIAQGAGWTERMRRGRLWFSGRDAVSFLQALVSNDVESVGPAGGAYATYLTPQGRLIADLAIYRRPEGILADVPAELASTLAARFDQLIFSEDVRVLDVSSSVAQLAVLGPEAAAILGRVLSLDAATLPALALRAVTSAGDVSVARTDDVDLPVFDVFVPAPDRAGFLTVLEAAGALHVSDAVVEALRIEAGHPAFGVDMTAETIPLEAGLLDRALSLSKGCYVGQEVIVRVLHRGGGRVAKRLVRMSFDAAGDPPPAGTSITAGDADVGRVTSAAISPRSGRIVALGYVHRDVAEVGRAVVAGGFHGVVEGLAG